MMDHTLRIWAKEWIMVWMLRLTSKFGQQAMIDRSTSSDSQSIPFKWILMRDLIMMPLASDLGPSAPSNPMVWWLMEISFRCGACRNTSARSRWVLGS